MDKRTRPQQPAGEGTSAGPAEELFLPSVPGTDDVRDFGLRLKRERELRGISLEEVARVTRVNRRYLSALEAGRADLLPAEPFVKGFLTAYARHVGLAPDEILSLYEESRREQQAPSREQRPLVASPQPGRRRRLPWVLLVIAAAAVAALAFWSRERAGEVLRRTPAGDSLPAEPAPPEEPPAAETVPPLTASPAGEATTPAPQEPSPPTTSGVEVALEAQQKSWVYAVLDERETRDFFLQPGERVVLSAKAGLTLTLGNAGGVSVTFNGRDLGPLGKPGEVKRDLGFSWDVQSGPVVRDPYARAVP